MPGGGWEVGQELGAGAVHGIWVRNSVPGVTAWARWAVGWVRLGVIPTSSLAHGGCSGAPVLRCSESVSDYPISPEPMSLVAVAHLIKGARSEGDQLLLNSPVPRFQIGSQH